MTDSKVVKHSLTFVLFILAFFAGGLISYGYLSYSPRGVSAKPEAPVRLLTNESWKNQTVKGVLFTLEGVLSNIDATERTVTVSKGSDLMTVRVDNSTQITRYTKPTGEASGSSVPGKEEIKPTDLKVGDRVGLNVQGQADGSLTTLDMVVF